MAALGRGGDDDDSRSRESRAVGGRHAERMRFSVWPSAYQPWDQILATARHAAATGRVRLGTLVYGNTYRHPAVVANMAATADHVSGGRFVLGVGAGWQVDEHEQYGITLPPVGERVSRVAEAVQGLRSLLTEPTTTFAGEHYR